MKLARLKEWREARGLTQRELAVEARASEWTITRAEADEEVRVNTARKIAEVLDVSVADLMESPPVPLGEAPSASGLEEGLKSVRDQSQVRNAGEWLAALISMAEHAEHELDRGLYDLQSILSLEGTVVEVFALYRLEARKRFREQSSQQLTSQFEEAEERMRRVRAAVRQASRTRLEQARVEAELDPTQLDDIEERRRARDERLRSIGAA